MNRPPIYLRVRPGHAKNWHKHCRQYNACGERVLFVQDSWYTREYAPRFREYHRIQGNEGRGGYRDNQYRDHRDGGRSNNHGFRRDR